MTSLDSCHHSSNSLFGFRYSLSHFVKCKGELIMPSLTSSNLTRMQTCSMLTWGRAKCLTWSPAWWPTTGSRTSDTGPQVPGVWPGNGQKTVESFVASNDGARQRRIGPKVERRNVKDLMSKDWMSNCICTTECQKLKNLANLCDIEPESSKKHLDKN